jgi:hypothetical protein
VPGARHEFADDPSDVALHGFRGGGSYVHTVRSVA